MIANPSKFQAIVFSKSNDPIKTDFQISDKVIKSDKSVELLGITFDYKLNFSTHIDKLCKKTNGPLNALYRLKHYLSKDSKRLALNSFILSNFNYCPLICHFSIFEAQNKFEKVYRRSFQLLDVKPDPNENGQLPLQVKRLRILATEIFKTLNGLNPSYMKTIFKASSLRRSSRLQFNMEVQKYNQIKYGRNSLRILGPMLCNSLPNEAKSTKSLPKFKQFIKSCGNNTCPHYKRFMSYISSV